MRKGFLWCLVLTLCSPVLLVGQLTVIMEQAPSYTPEEDTLYIVGSFNNWNPGDQNFQFEQLADGRWQFDFLTPMPDFEYKITRGSWKTGSTLRKYQP